MAISKSKREAVYRKYDGHCAYCGHEIAYKDMQVDHFQPLRAWGIEDAGTDDLDNLMPACRMCNHANGWEYGLQVDRIDNNKGYFPDNIQFVTRAENLRNKRTNHLITFLGETLCAADWCERFGISDSTLWRRLKSGWSIEDALTKPKQKRTKWMDGGDSE